MKEMRNCSAKIPHSEFLHYNFMERYYGTKAAELWDLHRI